MLNIRSYSLIYTLYLNALIATSIISAQDPEPTTDHQVVTPSAYDIRVQEINLQSLADFEDYLAQYRASLPTEGLTLSFAHNSNATVQLSTAELIALEARNLLMNYMPGITEQFMQDTNQLDLKTGVTWIAGATVLSSLTAGHLYQTYQANSFKQRRFWTSLLKLAGAGIAMDSTISAWSLYERQQLYRQKEQRIANRLIELGIASEVTRTMMQKVESLALQDDTKTRCLQRILDTVGFSKLRLYWEYK